MKFNIGKEIAEFREHWLWNVGFSTTPADFEKAESAISEFYRYLGKKEPQFIRVAGPFQRDIFFKRKLIPISSLLLNLEKSLSKFIENDIDESMISKAYIDLWLYLRRSLEVLDLIRSINRMNTPEMSANSLIFKKHFFGQEMSFKLAYYWFFREYLNVNYGDKNIGMLKLWTDITGIFAWWPYDDICVLCNRPKTINLKDMMLHCENGPSVEFWDGMKLFYLNNVKVPDWLVLTPANFIDPAVVLKEKNDRVKLEIMKKISIERFIHTLGGDVIDMWEDYSLIDISKFFNDRRIRPVFLKMRNASVEGLWHCEGVPEYISTVKDALSWRTGGLNWNPEQLT